MFELKIDSTLPPNEIFFICFCALQRSKEPGSDIYMTTHGCTRRTNNTSILTVLLQRYPFGNTLNSLL